MFALILSSLYILLARVVFPIPPIPTVTVSNCSAVALGPSRLGPGPEGGGQRVGEPLESAGSPEAVISKGVAPAQRSGRGARPDPSDDQVNERCGGGEGGGKASLCSVCPPLCLRLRGIYRGD